MQSKHGIIRTVKKETRNINGKEDANVEGGYRKYDVVRVDFGDIVLAGEQGGIRPAVIVQNNLGNLHSGTTLVIPFTSQPRSLTQSTHSFFHANKRYGLKLDSYLLGESMKSISELRIIEKLGTITKKEDKDEVRRVYFANWGMD